MNIFQQIRNLRANFTEPENMRVLLALYWQLLLGSVLVLIVGAFLYGGWQIMGVMNTVAAVPTTTSSATSSKAAVSSAQVDSVLDGFKTRQDQFETRKAGKSPIVDPAQ